VNRREERERGKCAKSGKIGKIKEKIYIIG
jgi:hypothetical protein